MEKTFERLPETIRINLEGVGYPDKYVLVLPKKKVSENFREFYLIDDDAGTVLYMFGAQVNDDYLAAEIAVLNISEYLETLEEMAWGKN